MTPSHDVTQLLQAWGHGDEAALDKLVPLIYKELRQRAHRYMGRQRPGHTLQTSALVNEAYLRLVESPPVTCKNCGHFYAIAAGMMRRISGAARPSSSLWTRNTFWRPGPVPTWSPSTTRSKPWRSRTRGRAVS